MPINPPAPAMDYEMHNKGIHYQDYSNVPISNYAKLIGYDNPGSPNPSTVYFGTDNFLPDYEHPTRLNRIQLIKGAAIQHCMPAPQLKIIDIQGWCRRPADRILLMRFFYSNIPGYDMTVADPYPTDYLPIRRDYYKLVMPTGDATYVRFASTPTFTIERGTTGRILYAFAVRFYPVVENDDLDY